MTEYNNSIIEALSCEAVYMLSTGDYLDPQNLPGAEEEWKLIEFENPLPGALHSSVSSQLQNKVLITADASYNPDQKGPVLECSWCTDENKIIESIRRIRKGVGKNPDSGILIRLFFEETGPKVFELAGDSVKETLLDNIETALVAGAEEIVLKLDFFRLLQIAGGIFQTDDISLGTNAVFASCLALLNQDSSAIESALKGQNTEIMKPSREITVLARNLALDQLSRFFSDSAIFRIELMEVNSSIKTEDQ